MKIEAKIQTVLVFSAWKWTFRLSSKQFFMYALNVLSYLTKQAFAKIFHHWLVSEFEVEVSAYQSSDWRVHFKNISISKLRTNFSYSDFLLRVTVNYSNGHLLENLEVKKLKNLWKILPRVGKCAELAVSIKLWKQSNSTNNSES